MSQATGSATFPCRQTETQHPLLQETNVGVDLIELHDGIDLIRDELALGIQHFLVFPTAFVAKVMGGDAGFCAADKIFQRRQNKLGR